MSPDDSVPEPDAVPELRIERGSPSAAELAAISAVLAGVVEELAADYTRRSATTVSAWSRSQRGIRTPLHPAAGAWRSFS